MEKSERQLRRLIRKLIGQNTDPVEIPKNPRVRSNIDFKRNFQRNADQKSLQRLRYIHWCNPHEVHSILKGSGKNEISTCIHSRNHPLIPWKLDESFAEDVPTIGIELKGFVTIAANLDLASGRHGVNYRTNDKVNPGKEFQKMTSGLPKRASEQDYLNRGKNYPNMGLIYSEDDLKIYRRYNYDSIDAEWPEAILDNWNPVAMWYDDGEYNPVENQTLASVIQMCNKSGIKIKKVSEWPH